MGTTNIIKVRFMRDDQPQGREYTYCSPEEEAKRPDPNQLTLFGLDEQEK